MSEPTYDQLVAELRAGDPQAASRAAEALGRLGDRRAVEPLIALLGQASSPLVWNAAAIALHDLGDARAVEAILARLSDPATEGARGSLVWALRGFDVAPCIERLVELVIDGNYEVSREAAGLILSIEREIEVPRWEACIARLKAALPRASDEQAGLLRDLLEEFESAD
jgi:HEAT repeat protein